MRTLAAPEGVLPFMCVQLDPPVQGIAANNIVLGPSQSRIISITCFNPPGVVASCSIVTL